MNYDRTSHSKRTSIDLLLMQKFINTLYFVTTNTNIWKKHCHKVNLLENSRILIDIYILYLSRKTFKNLRNFWFCWFWNLILKNKFSGNGKFLIALGKLHHFNLKYFQILKGNVWLDMVVELRMQYLQRNFLEFI